MWRGSGEDGEEDGEDDVVRKWVEANPDQPRQCQQTKTLNEGKRIHEKYCNGLCHVAVIFEAMQVGIRPNPNSHR